MYKITKSDKTTELHESLHWCKHQEKNDIMISCDESEGEVILSLDQSVFYNVNFKPVIHERFEMVTVEEMRWYPIVTEQNLNAKLAVVELVEQQQIDKLDNQLALAELIESIMSATAEGGE